MKISKIIIFFVIALILVSGTSTVFASTRANDSGAALDPSDPVYKINRILDLATNIIVYLCYFTVFYMFVETMLLAIGKDTSKDIFNIFNLVLGIMPGILALAIPTILVIVKLNSKKKISRIIINIFIIIFVCAEAGFIDIMKNWPY